MNRALLIATMLAVLAPAAPASPCDFGYWQPHGADREVHQIDFKAYELTLTVNDTLTFDDPRLANVRVDDPEIVQVVRDEDVAGRYRLTAQAAGKAVVRVYFSQQAVELTPAQLEQGEGLAINTFAITTRPR